MSSPSSGRVPAGGVATPLASVGEPPKKKKKDTKSTGDKSSGTPMDEQEKQGAKLFGCCCDYRRAVILLAAFYFCLGMGNCIFYFASEVPAVGIKYDDDAVLEILDDLSLIIAILAAVSMVTSICAIVGATKYNIWLVGINAVWVFVSFAVTTITSIEAANDVNQTDPDPELSLVLNVIVWGVLTLIVIYPHIGFMYEVSVGIMSFETYPREKYYCCCALDGM